MYFVALGIGNVMAITQFFQFVVYDTINIRYEDWRTAYELMVLESSLTCPPSLFGDGATFAASPTRDKSSLTCSPTLSQGSSPGQNQSQHTPTVLELDRMLHERHT